MGGKTKQSQRTKNNTRPSNSGRSAELLGATIPSFVGFTAHSDLGIVPLAPGFAISENLPDTFDASISTQYQLIFRKMSKKDPITKTKALQEFSELINNSDLDAIKTILPLWPKFYCNLANDVEHRVRETAQQAQSAIIDKAGKFIAPYLKQLAPVWIASQFDNYAPAASLALSTFRTSFAPHKVQEVFSFCQNEILEYISKNLLYHSPSTLNSAKLYTPEEAENKYSRIVVCSLRMFSLYLEKITKEKISEVDEKIKNIIQNSKFWSFAKNKDANIKSAWFELLYTFLQNFPSFFETNKQQTIQIVFQNIDDTNPITTSHIWGCVLLIQTTYDDWYTFLNFKKAVQPKLFSLIKNNRKCATVFYPNLFPFITKLSDDTVQNSSIKEFYIDLFDKIKESIKNLNSSDNKSDITAVVTALYECLRYIIQKESNQNEYDLIYYENLIQNYVLELIEWTIMNDTVSMKSIFLNVSILIAYLSKNVDKSDLYIKLLNKFWTELQKIFKKNSGINIGDNSTELNRCLELVQNLYTANTSHSSGKVKFSSPNDEDNNYNREEEITTNQNLKQKSKNLIPNILIELRTIAIQLARTYVGKILNEKNIKLSSQLKILVQMFGNIEFYLQITNKNDLKSTFELFTNFLCNDYEPCESMLDVVFGILFLLNKNDQMKYIEELLKIPNPIIQQWIINRLLSYPLCIEPDIRKILSYDYVSEIIINFAKDFIQENSKEKFNLLHKCFFQIDSGEILINQRTIEGIVKILSEPLINYSNDNENGTSNNEILDTCGSFIAQIMPVICSNNVSVQLQNDIFLKLFKFSIEQITDNENISEDTLWEIITCWQDALSSNDIKIDNELMNKCSEIIEKYLITWNNTKDENDENNIISIQDITSISDFTAKLIICSLESITEEKEHFKLLDNLINSLLGNKNSLKYQEICDNLNILCSHFELIDGIYTNLYPKEYNIIDLSSIDIRNYFRKKFYNFMVIYKLICNIKSEEEKTLKRNLSSIDGINVNGISKNNDNSDNVEDDDEDDDEDREYTEDYIDPNEQILKNWSNSVYEYFISSMETSTLGESLMVNSNLINNETEVLILNLTEKINLALKNLPELFITSLKEKIFSNIKPNDISTIRIINLLKILNQYSKDDNGPILLFEDATNAILDENNFEAYLNITQVMLKNIPSRCLPINYDVLNENICIKIRKGYLRCLISDIFSGDYNEITDKKIISYCLKLITEIDTRKTEDKTLLLYNVDISKEDVKRVYTVVELINLLNVILDKFPTQLDIKSWDMIRIGLSSWVLSVSKCIEKWYNSKVSIFILSVYKLFKTLSKFIREEKIKSSTEELSNIIDEWENVFALEINLILFKSYIYLVTCENDEISLINRVSILDKIASSIEYLDYGVIFKASQTTFKYKTDDIIKFCLNNLSNKIHSVRITCVFLIQKLTPYLVPIDIENLEKQTDVAEKANRDVNNLDNWHLIHKFVTFLEKYQTNVEKYLNDFSYKLTDLPNFKPIERDEALTYFYIWDCVIFICSKSPSELRSLYASTITENKFEQILLNFIFRSMPIEILKNHDSKVMSNEIFKKLNWAQFKDQNISIEKLSCYVYTQMLRYLPAVVRKWWNTTNARQKTFIDKLTTNFVSNLICNEELKAIAKHEKHENMQVTVHTSTREVIAIYSIDEARMELNITLASNHPLGAVKVENIKQIGSRAQSRNLGMQLTIFLTHQNGSIFDGLSIWKKNLDKKFEGVEECYVCYTVIHQDTCQLPKLSCRTCKKKFHGPCLYKWFTTSSKSTCPICRNVF